MSSQGKIFREIAKSDANVVFDKDKTSNQRYLIFNSYEEALKYKEAFGTLINENTEAAQLSNVTYLDFSGNQYTSLQDSDAKLNIVTVKLDKNHLIIINNADLRTVRKEFLGDKTEYTHSVTFKNAEFHGYLHFKNLLTCAEFFPGTSVREFGKWFGGSIIRNDRVYDSKYYRHNVFIKGGLNPVQDKASVGIEVLITQEQLEKAREVLAELLESFTKSASAAQYLHDQEAYTVVKGAHYVVNRLVNDENFYNFFYNNCHHSVYRLYKELGFKGHYLHFVRADHLDIRDVGVLHSLSLAHGIPTALMSTEHVHDLKDQGVVKKINKLLSKGDDLSYITKESLSIPENLERANQQDENGDNALHLALKRNEVEKAELLIDAGIDVNVPNKRGEIALHLAAGMKPSAEKLKLLEKIITSTLDIDAKDLFADNTPLSFAVRSDDAEAIKLLVQNGADLHFINSTHEKLSNIAAEYSAKNAAKVLQELEPEIMHFDNLTRQIPIHHPRIKDVLEVPENIAVKAKTTEEEYIIISDINPYFDILVALVAQPEVV
jgi:hypothetical protein